MRGFIALAALSLVVVGCNPGLYPIDIFPEMHYQPQHRRLEPDRRSPPRDAVPSTTGSRPWPQPPSDVPAGRPLLTFEQASLRQNPVPATPDHLARGRQIYQVNCLACHGVDGQGNTLVAIYLRRRGAQPPTDFTSARVRGRSDGELHWLITYGIGGMPPFGELLTDQERWATVRVVREFQEP